MPEEYILLRAQQCVEGFVVNYLKRRESQRNSKTYNDLYPYTMARGSFWKHNRYSEKIMFKNST